MTESSTLAMTAVMMLPFMYFITKHVEFTKRIPFFTIIMYLTAFAAIVTIIGSHARTGIVGLAILIGIVFLGSKQKLKLSILSILIVLFAWNFGSDNWKERMLTLKESKTESSALGRIVVWRWTIDYVSERPIMGGGFMSYKANAGQLRDYNKEDAEVDYRDNSGKAFHNIYIEVLGEHGYVGLVIFMLIIFTTWKQNRFVMKSSADTWYQMAARSNNAAFLVFCACGMFIGVAFSPWAYLFFGISTALKQLYLNEPKAERQLN